MPLIASKGSKNARIWCLFEKPFSSDVEKAQLLSGGLGYIYSKMFAESSLDMNLVYFTCRAPDTDHPMGFINLDAELNQYKPPIVLVTEDIAGWFLPELRERNSLIATSAGQMAKYAGSLLSSDKLSYPHYMMPVYSPMRCVQDWQERNITTYVDLQKARDEFEYWKKHGALQPLPARVLKYQDMDLDELLSYLDRFSSAKILSDDIENPTYRSKQYFPHPGYPFLLGLADSPDFGISFKLFRDKPSENRVLWRKLDKLLYEVPVLVGQNFFNYDAMFHEAISFRVRLDRVQDTLVRHHILWPELSHKLQFMNRQYTREPYYKDEGQGWSMKYLDKYRRYNALDACDTMEIYLGQEEEFKQRKHLAA
jgi:hypothetical protein